MQFPQDGGVSCLRYHLSARNDGLEAFARELVSSDGICAGHLVCQCGADDCWFYSVAADGTFAVAYCGCNGSSLPIYIGPPPNQARLKGGQSSRCRAGHDIYGPLVVAIGYAGSVPRLGTLDVERAAEVAVVLECRACAGTRVAWSWRPSPPIVIRGDEPWLDSIQGSMGWFARHGGYRRGV